MKTIVRQTMMTLFTISLGFGLMTFKAEAAPIEERQGVMTDAPSPTPPLPDAEEGGAMVRLGTTKLPADVLNKLDAKQLADILELQAAAPKTTVQHVFNEAILVPAIVFASLTLVSFLFIYFSFRKRRETLETVRVAIQSGQTLPASFLEALETRSKPTPDSDLRKAVLLIALGLSAMGVLAALGEEDAGRAWSIGLVPTLLGIGYLFLWRQSQKRLKTGLNDDRR